MRRLVLLLVLALGAPTLAGCGVLLGSRYDNFRAYYNTFYNARRSFDEGERALEVASRRGVDRTHLLPLFLAPPEEGPVPGAQPFEDAVEKSADLLRERPGSKWVDDALLLIGQSYVYLRNYVGAEGKFREAIAEAEARRKPELADEARLWLGRALGAARRYDEGAATLRDGIERMEAEGRRQWLPEMRVALGELHARGRQWDEAAAALEAGIPTVRDGDLAARALFLLGQVHEAAGRPADAADAYGRALQRDPPYPLAYAAELNRALALGLAAGRHDDALAAIGQMRRDDNHFDNRAEVALAQARLLAAAGRRAEAERTFRTLLYAEQATDRVGGPLRGEAYYRLGEYYRDTRGDFVRAAIYFDTSATNVRIEPTRDELVTNAALVGVRRQADVYGAFASLAGGIAEADSLLRLGSLSEADFRAEVAQIEERRRVAYFEEQRRLERRRVEQGFGEGPILRDDGGRRGLGGEETSDAGGSGSSDEGGGRGPSAGAEVGFLSYREPALVQDARIAFERVWGDRPLVRNWRRREAVGGAIAAGTPGIGPEGATALANTGRGDGPPPLDLLDVPRAPEAQARLRARRAGLRYELGNVLFLSVGRADSAAAWYRLVLEEDAADPVALRAAYALAEVERQAGRTAEAEALYRRVLADAPDSDLARQARQRLGLDDAGAGAVDSTALAERAYADAWQRWQAGELAAALDDFAALATRYPRTPVAPRALLAAGLVYAEAARTAGAADPSPYPLPDPASVVPDPRTPPLDGAQGVNLAPGAEGLGTDGAPSISAGTFVSDRASGRTPLSADGLEANALGANRAVEGPDVTGSAVTTDPVANTATANSATGAVPPATQGDPGAFDAPGAATPAPVPAGESAAGVSPGAGALVLPAGLVTASANDDPLDALYARIEADYPGTVYAERAAAFRAVLNVGRPDPSEAAGSLASPTDSVAALANGVPPEPVVPEAYVNPDAPPEAFGLRGERPLDVAVGGYTWRVASVPSPLAARAILRSFVRRGLRAAVATEPAQGEAMYLVVLGQFASADAARAVRTDLPSEGMGRDVRVVAVEGLQFVAEDALGEGVD